jgi:hypothetical protein
MLGPVFFYDVEMSVFQRLETFTMIRLLSVLIALELLNVQPTTTARALELRWAADGFVHPTSVLLHPDGDKLLISNGDGPAHQADGRGFISLLSLNGDLLNERFIDGLDAPTGMASVDGVLYVADLMRLRLFDLASGRPLGQISPPDAQRLTHLTAGADGRIFASDPYAATIYSISNGRAVRWSGSEQLSAPRALVVVGGELVIADGRATPGSQRSDAGQGGLKAIDLHSGLLRQLNHELDHGVHDGLAATEEGFFLSSSTEGRLYKIDAFGDETLLFLVPGIADFILVGDLLIIPFTYDGLVRAYRMRR